LSEAKGSHAPAWQEIPSALRTSGDSANTLEPRLDRQIDSELLSRIQSAGDVKAEQTVDERHARADAAHRASDGADRPTIAHPTEIGEQRRTRTGGARADFRTAKPVGVARLRRVRRLSAHRLQSTEVPSTLHGK